MKLIVEVVEAEIIGKQETTTQIMNLGKSKPPRRLPPLVKLSFKELRPICVEQMRSCVGAIYSIRLLADKEDCGGTGGRRSSAGYPFFCFQKLM